MARKNENSRYSALVQALEAAAIAYEAIAREPGEYGDIDIHLIARCVNRANTLRGQAMRIDRFNHV